MKHFSLRSILFLNPIYTGAFLAGVEPGGGGGGGVVKSDDSNFVQNYFGIGSIF